MKDLTRQKFGRLTVIHKTRSYNKNSHWMCICDCGQRIEVSRPHLIQGHTRSCGCITNLDLTGETFGLLTVLCLYEKRGNKKYWLCECACGTFGIYGTQTLCQTKNKSCGCLLEHKMVGTRFGRLIVTSFSHRKETVGFFWNCLCDCGNTSVLSTSVLRSGSTQSCGCYRKDKITKHNMHKTRIYSKWRSMLSRCRNPRNINYKNYGGRGITVSDSWLDFENFYGDMGDPPTDKHQIDRINNEGNYEASNCRWVTNKENARNKRTNRLITLGGKTQCVSAWAEDLNIKVSTINHRLGNDWPGDVAISRPPGYKNEWQLNMF